MSTEVPSKGIKNKLKQFWQNYETKIVLAIGFILVAVIAFEAGALKGQKWQKEPLIVEKPAMAIENANLSNSASNSQNNAPEASKLTQEGQATGIGSSPNQNCAFVGSKNSNKYHLPTCRFAKNIKPENLVCFSSVDDAVKKGYQPDKTCIK
jgi:hypothetical protein